HLIEIFGRRGIDDSLSVRDNMTTLYIYSSSANLVIRRLYDTAPVTGGGGTEDEQIKARRAGDSVASAKREQERTIWKWALMWRSIILSALDQTYLPYYSYIRQLNLDDLSELLSHSGFKGKIKE